MAEMTIKRFGPISVAKMYGLLCFVMGLIIGLIYGLIVIVSGAAITALAPSSSEGTAGGISTIVVGILIMIGMPLFYGFFGFIAGLIGALIYNGVAKIVGGVELELEGSQARLLGLSLLGSEDFMERRAELVDVGHDLLVHRVGENHQGNLVGDFRQASWHVGVRAPRRYGVVVELAFAPVLDTPTLADARQGGLDNLIIGPPVPHHLIQAIGGEVLDELIHLLGRDTIGEQFARHVSHLKVGQRAVAVKGNKLGSKKAHECSPG